MLPNTVFRVLDEPCCVWGGDIKERNLDFIEGLSGGYFEYVAQTCARTLEEGGRDQYSATLLRATYHHGLETLFSYIGALVQSPNCIYGWLLRYRPMDIPDLVERISSGKSMHTLANLKSLSWGGIAEWLFNFSSDDPTEAVKNIATYEILFSRLATDYLKETTSLEYNSIKHGFRIKPGGFSLIFCPDGEDGKPQMDKQKVLVESPFGSTILTLEPTPSASDGNRSFHSKQTCLNWSFDGTCSKLLLISVAISNLVNAMKILNGIQRNTLSFYKPVEEEAYNYPWTTAVQDSAFGMGLVYSEGATVKTTKHQLFKVLNDEGPTQSPTA